MDEIRIPIPITLLQRICDAFLEMQAQGARTKDTNLMEDLDKALAREDRRR